MQNSNSNLEHGSEELPSRDFDPETAGEDDAYKINVIPASDKKEERKSMQSYDLYVRIMDLIDAFNNTQSRCQRDWQDLQKLISLHIEQKLYPEAKTQAGKRLLRNGKFLLCFIDMVTRNSSNNFLKMHLYDYFKSNMAIQTDEILFQISLKNFFLTQSRKNAKNFSIERVSGTINYSNIAEDGEKSHHSSNISQYKKASESQSNQIKRYSVDKKMKSNSLHLKKKKRKKSQVKRKSMNNSKPEYKMLQKRIQTQEAENQKNKREKLGSCYHYEIQKNTKTKNKEIRQVRTSARIRNKSESKEKSVERMSIVKSKRKRSLRKSKKQAKSSIRKSVQIKLDDDRNLEIEQGSDGSWKKSSQQKSQEQISVNWLKEHLPQLEVKKALLEDSFVALTSQDKEITKFLSSFEEKDENDEKSSQKVPSQSENHEEENQSRRIEESQQDAPEIPPIQVEEQDIRKSISRQLKEEKPLVVSKVIDPDINNHGIYALLKLGKWSVLDFGSRYAVTPISMSSMMKKRHIVQDLRKAQQITGAEKGELAFVQMSSEIMELIEQAKKEEKND